MKCANCGTESSGNFCPSCGAAMRAAECANCGAGLVAGARFCTRCGTAVAGASTRRARGAARAPAADAGGRSSNMPWYIAAGVLGVLIIVLLVPMLRDSAGGGATTTQAPFAPGATTPGTPPPLTGTPREQADRLFNRIMTSRESGDTADAMRFTPMAISAYNAVEPLDDDGLYHLAIVHIVARDYTSARATAERILARNPNHLLALATAGEAAELAGDNAAARDYYRRFLDAWDTEIGRALPEYQDHARIFEEYRANARRVVGTGG